MYFCSYLMLYICRVDHDLIFFFVHSLNFLFFLHLILDNFLDFLFLFFVEVPLLYLQFLLVRIFIFFLDFEVVSKVRSFSHLVIIFFIVFEMVGSEYDAAAVIVVVIRHVVIIVKMTHITQSIQNIGTAKGTISWKYVIKRCIICRIYIYIFPWAKNHSESPPSSLSSSSISSRMTAIISP